MRIVVRTQSSVEAAFVQEAAMAACPLKGYHRNGRWLLEVPSGSVCEPFLERAQHLPVETRKNLARHLVSEDPEILELIRSLKL